MTAYCKNVGQFFCIVAMVTSFIAVIQSGFDNQWFLFLMFWSAFITSMAVYGVITRHIIDCEEYELEVKLK